MKPITCETLYLAICGAFLVSCGQVFLPENSVTHNRSIQINSDDSQEPTAGLDLVGFSAPDVNGDGNDMADYGRAFYAYKQINLLTKLPSTWGVTVQSTLLDVAPVGRKDGKITTDDAVAIVQDYLDKALDYEKHAYGVKKVADEITACLNNVNCKRDASANVKKYDVNMNGLVEPQDVLLLSNFSSCIDILRGSASYTKPITVSSTALSKYCGY